MNFYYLTLTVFEFWKKLHKKHFEKNPRKFSGHFYHQRGHHAKGHHQKVDRAKKRYSGAPSMVGRATCALWPHRGSYECFQVLEHPSRPETH